MHKIPGSKAMSLVERDHKVVSQSYPRDYPFVMDHGKGVYVWDVDGNKFLDFTAGIAVNSTGYSHPDVVKAIQEQAEKFIHISSDFYHEKWVEVSEKLNEIAPFEEEAVVFATNSGTESIETALKLARYYTGRTQFIAFLGGFHGRTYGSVTLTASKNKYHRGFYPVMNGVTHIPFPDPYRPVLQMNEGEDVGDAVIRYLENEIFGHLVPHEDVAGIVVEPIQGEGGYVVPPASFFPKLRELCTKYGILLISDEVQAGVGRTGKWWAIQNFGVEPDIIATAKGIASGVPFGAMVARKSIVTWKKGAHGNTYGGNPLACAASLETLRLIEGGYMQNAAEVGQHCLDKLKEMQSRHPSMGVVRGIGLMIGVEFVKDRGTREPAVELRDAIVHRAFENGLLTMGCGTSTIRICPPLCITEAEMDEGLAILDEAIAFVEKAG
jgi:4-aminobutyrate aminotransferase